MLPLLCDRSWRISYSSNENNPIADFYLPALECAAQSDRKSGFFNSAILSKVARGLGAMLHNEGKMWLIMGCQFSPQDLQAIQQGYELREALLTRLDAELNPPENFVTRTLPKNGDKEIEMRSPTRQCHALDEETIQEYFRGLGGGSRSSQLTWNSNTF